MGCRLSQQAVLIESCTFCVPMCGLKSADLVCWVRLWPGNIWQKPFKESLTLSCRLITNKQPTWMPRHWMYTCDFGRLFILIRVVILVVRRLLLFRTGFLLLCGRNWFCLRHFLVFRTVIFWRALYWGVLLGHCLGPVCDLGLDRLILTRLHGHHTLVMLLFSSERKCWKSKPVMHQMSGLTPYINYINSKGKIPYLNFLLTWTKNPHSRYVTAAGSSVTVRVILPLTTGNAKDLTSILPYHFQFENLKKGSACF